MKVAIFVEGQTELILVREMLLKLFNYQNINLECFNLYSKENLQVTEYHFLNERAEYYFQIVNVGNDNAVLARILRREQRLLDAGFDRIIGLRDMYSKAYREAVGNANIDLEINEQFKVGHQEQVNNNAVMPERIFFRFAIMETEAWLLGLAHIFDQIDENLTIDFIEQQLGYNLDSIDPEILFFQPANELKTIFELVGKTYDKSRGDVNSIVSLIERNDYMLLELAEKCNSYSAFYQAIPQAE